MTVVDLLLDADPSIRWQVMRYRWNTLRALRVLRWWNEGRRTAVASGAGAAAAG